jgi:hypothetical protein
MRAIKPELLGNLLKVPGNSERLGFAPCAFVEHEKQEESDTRAGYEYERELQRLCEGSLAQKEIWFHHLSTRARESTGMPDLLFVLSGRPCAVELKSRTGKLRKEQREVMARMKSNGWEVYLIRSWEEWLGVFDLKTKQWEPE